MISMVDMFIIGMENENDMFDIDIRIICVNIFENTDQFLKIQTKYGPIFYIFLKRSLLQTKIIFTYHCVITGYVFVYEVFKFMGSFSYT